MWTALFLCFVATVVIDIAYCGMNDIVREFPKDESARGCAFVLAVGVVLFALACVIILSIKVVGWINA